MARGYTAKEGRYSGERITGNDKVDARLLSETSRVLSQQNIKLLGDSKAEVARQGYAAEKAAREEWKGMTRMDPDSYPADGIDEYGQAAFEQKVIESAKLAEAGLLKRQPQTISNKEFIDNVNDRWTPSMEPRKDELAEIKKEADRLHRENPDEYNIVDAVRAATDKFIKERAERRSK